MRSHTQAALICKTQGRQLHPETGEVETRKRRKSHDASVHKAVRSTESGRTQRVEHGRQGAGNVNARAMDVTAAQELEVGTDAQGGEKQGASTNEENNVSTRGTKRVREEDNGHTGNNTKQRGKAAEQISRRTTVVQNVCDTSTYTTITTVSNGH